MKKIIFIGLITVLMLTSAFVVRAEENENPTETFYTGLTEMSEEELESFHNTIPMIVDVKPNSMALSRLSEEESVLFENIEVAEIGEEIACAIPNESINLISTTTAFPLTSSVDVSESLTFPPIGNQGQTNSCLPWAFCYYQLTNNTCFVRNLHARTQDGVAIQENIIAPGFIYSLVNEGTNSGTKYDEVSYAIAHSGCPTADVYPLEITDESLRQWSSDINVWYDAMYNKPKRISHIPIPTDNIVNGETYEIVRVKEILSNGYVVTFSTYIQSWEFTNKTTTGEYACKYMKNDMKGAHAMTVVGYNDEFWVDINDNNIVDDGEFGAFKLVNSWGYESSFFPNGYAWVPYDAFGNASSVVNVATDRISVMKEDFYFIEPWKSYTPLLVAEVEITTPNREYIIANFNVIDSTTNEVEYLLPVLTHENIATVFYRWKSNHPQEIPRNTVNFSGTTGEETITVPFDLTSIINSELDTITPGTLLRVYADVGDGNLDDGLPVSYNLVKIVEPTTRETANYIGGAISISDYWGDVKYIDFQITPLVGCSETQSIALEFNSDVKTKLVNESIYLRTPENEKIYPDCEVVGNRIIVYCPENAYDYNTKYELHVTKNVISKGGNSLNDEIVIPIYIVTEVTTGIPLE